ncbi:MAG: M20/M25/M40 family metallo-hydrolase [Deltaproteobacteria bacterium]|jgi:glutamate carboxypeptidase|nr:M20/M25/M40 family metallo-hydrolase [Deltaproteobacteria bacterium]
MNVTKMVEDIRREAGRLHEGQMGLLRDLVSHDSGTGDLEGNGEVVGALEPLLAGLAWEVERREAPGVGTHLVARVGMRGARRKVLCLAHLDTVFGTGDAARHPFRIEGDRAYGLGVADCKGGVVVSLYGLMVAHGLGLIPRDLEIAVIYNCDEETGSETSKPIFESEARGASLAFVFEPARGRGGVITSRRGCAFGRVEVDGREAHGGSAYPAGSDANLALARIVASLGSHGLPSRGIFFNVGTMSGGRHADIVSDRARADFFVTFADNDDLAYIRQTVEKVDGSVWAPGCRSRASVGVSFPPLERTEGNIAAYGLLRKAGQGLGLDLPEESSPGSSDGCWCGHYGVPVIDALGPYMHDIHTKEESLALASVRERTELFALAVALLDEEYLGRQGR